jgi:hypothetical protein
MASTVKVLRLGVISTFRGRGVLLVAFSAVKNNKRLRERVRDRERAIVFNFIAHRIRSGAASVEQPL